LLLLGLTSHFITMMISDGAGHPLLFDGCVILRSGASFVPIPRVAAFAQSVGGRLDSLNDVTHGWG